MKNSNQLAEPVPDGRSVKVKRAALLWSKYKNGIIDIPQVKYKLFVWNNNNSNNI